jgi:porin
MAGVYNGRPGGDCPEDEDPQACNDHGLDFPVDDPVLVMFEGGYKYRLAGRPGAIKLGGWHQEGRFPLLLDDTTVEEESYGLYAIIDQMIYQVSEGSGVSVFARVIGAPEDKSLIDFYWEAGFTFTGMIASRPDDVLGIGFAYTGISDDASAAQAIAGEEIILDYEALIEVSYTAEIVPGFTIQPDFQYFWNPGGHAADPDDPTKAVENAAVIGVRSTVNY